MLDTSSGRSHRVRITGNLSHSMRANYEEHGVDNYYKQVGASYRNPHFPGVRACMFTWLERWWAHEQKASCRTPLLFDMACGMLLALFEWPHSAELRPLLPGSGEVTAAAYEWWKRGISSIQPGKKGFAPTLILEVVREKATGLEAESTAAVVGKVPDDLLFIAADPYTQVAYTQRTTLPCAPLSFRDIGGGSLPPIVSAASSIESGCGNHMELSINKIDMVVCSFALHLIESPSELFVLLRELSTKVNWLVVLAPHKKPEIKGGWGWIKWDTESWCECGMYDRREFILERVHCRVYRSINVLHPEVSEMTGLSL